MKGTVKGAAKDAEKDVEKGVVNGTQQTLAFAEQQCKQRGVKLTKKRALVLSCLLDTKKALSAYELVDVCKQSYNETIPPMSVYRILDFLQESGLVHRLDLANKYVACSHISCAHDHQLPQFLICGQCQKVEEISISKAVIDSLNQNVADAGFHMVSQQVEMNCVCHECVDA